MFSEGAFDRPSVTQSVADGVLRYTKASAPLSDRQCFSVVGEVVILSRVAVLLRDCCPTAVFRRIGSIIIDTVHGTSIGTIAHVSQEVHKGFAPSLADGNPTRPVPLVGFVARGITSRNHLGVSIPQVMGRVSMRGIVLSCRIWTQAPTALSSAGRKLRTLDLALSAALALAVPDCAAAFVHVRERQYGQAAKTLTGDVVNARAKVRGMMGLHREPPLFSVTWAGTFERRRPTCLFTSLLYHKNIYLQCDGTYE